MAALSKTLGSIITLAGAVAVNVIPGLGQLASAAILIGSAALGYVVASLDHGHEKPQGTEVAIKSPTPPRVSGYGEGRHYMAYALYVTTNNGVAIDVGAMHDGRINRITGYWLGDTKIELLGTGYVKAGEAGQFGEDSDIVRVYTRMGLPTETAFSQVTALIPDQWTSDHRGDGVVTACVITKPTKAKYWQMIFPTGGPNNMPLSLAMERQLVFDWRDPTQSHDDPSTWKYSDNFILALAHYELVRDNKDWETHFLPTLSCWTAAANDADLPVPLKGVQTVLVEAADHGSGHITVTSNNGLSTGMTIVISATGDTSLTETRTVTGISGSVGAWVLALSSNLSNDHPAGSQVTWSSSSGSPATEPRYRTCLAHQHTDSHKSVVAGLLACGDGWMAPRSDGALVVYSGRYYEPTVEIGPDDIVSYSLQDGVDEEEAVNSIAVTYVSKNHDFNVVDTDPWVDEDDIEERGKILSSQLANQVPSHSQARRLAKRARSQTMAPKRGTTTTRSTGRKILGQRYIRQNITESGVTFLNAVVEVIAPVKRNLQTGGVTYAWRLADPNIDAWNPATEEGDPAPVGNRVAPQPLTSPSITSATADFSSVSDDGTGVRLTIVAAGPDRDDLTWYARWRIVDAPSWNEAQYSDVDPGASVTLETGFVPSASTVEVEVAYSVGDGRVSPYSDAVEVDTATDTTAPDAATAITLVSWADTLSLSTGRISRASSYRWRFFDPSDTSTPIRTISTSTPTVAYTSVQAATDGARRDYVVTVAGVNAAGAGTEASTSTLTLAAPSTVTGFAAADGTSESEVTFTLNTDPGVTGYMVAISTVSGFDPFSQGTLFRFLGSPAYLQNLAAGTFYAKIAAYDAWTDRPDLLNFSDEDPFTISTGGGGIGGGGGGGGGGYCVTTDTPILMADGAEKIAQNLVVGDMIRTQHETTLEWGDYPVSAISFVEDDVYSLDIGTGVLRATAGHKMMINGAWIRMDALGYPSGRAMVAKITVDDAHTYVSRGVLSHNVKQNSVDS